MGNCCDCLKPRQQKQHNPEVIEQQNGNRLELQDQNLINKPIASTDVAIEMRNYDLQHQATQSDSYTSYLSKSDNDQDEFFDKLDSFLVSQLPYQQQKDEYEINREQKIFEPQTSEAELKISQQHHKILDPIQKQQKISKRLATQRSSSSAKKESNLSKSKRKLSQENKQKSIPFNYLLHYKFQNVINNPPQPITQSTRNILSDDDDAIIQMEPFNIQDEESPLGSEIHDLSYNCQKCGQEIKQDIYQLQCYHSFHKGCLLELVEEQINQDRIKIVCFCQSSIQSSIIRKLMVVGEENTLLKRYFSNQYEAIHKNIF